MSDQKAIDQQIQKNLHRPQTKSWRAYARLTVGSESCAALFYHEVITGLFGSIPGALGLWLRRTFYPKLFKSAGARLIVGRHTTLRGTANISIGKHVAIDDGAVLDARGENAQIIIGDGVLISRNTIVRARNGIIRIGDHADIGANCILATDSSLDIGRKTLVAAFTYISAGGAHRYDNPDVPIADQGFVSKGGCKIGDDVWIGSHTTVLDGAAIGNGTIVGAHSLVNKNLPGRCVAWGVPAVSQRNR